MKRKPILYTLEYTDKYDVLYIIGYHMVGGYHLATLETPAEYPEPEVKFMRNAATHEELENIPEEVYDYINENHND